MTILVADNRCCGGYDGMIPIDDTHAETWVSGMCGGRTPAPDDYKPDEWRPLASLSAADQAEVLSDEKYMDKIAWVRDTAGRWLEDKVKP